MNYQAVEETIKADYRAVTEQYRRDDEVEVTTGNYLRIRENLVDICNSFPHPIRALEVGCGTGRYFHCLTNVTELTGIDITQEMLAAAAQPVRRSEITVERIRLVRANAYLTDFPPGSFHFIYSLGMFGNGCPVTTELCDKFHRWLAPVGKIYFNTVDTAGLPFWQRVRREARSLAYRLAGSRGRRILDERQDRHPFFGLTRRELERIVGQSSFNDFCVTSHVCRSPLWSGRHLECIALKC